MSWIEIILISLLYYCGSSFWLDGWLTVNHPFIGSFLVGCIMGEPALGAYYGAFIQLMFMGWMRMGGNDTIDSCFGGIVASALAISNQLDLGTTLLLAYLFSRVTRNVWNVRNTYNGKLMPLADQAAANGDVDAINKINTFSPQPFLLLITALPCAVILIGGSALLQLFYSSLPQIVLRYLQTVGTLLPLIGIGATLKLSLTKQNFDCFLCGALLCFLFPSIKWVIFSSALIIAIIVVTYRWKKIKIHLPKRENAYALVHKRDIIYADIKMYFLQYQSVNYERYQALGFVQSVCHILKKLYPNDSISEPLLRYSSEAYNIEPYSGTELMGAVIAMEEDKIIDQAVSSQDISDFKNFMVSPISAIGDQMNQFLGNTILLSLGMAFTLFSSINGGWISLVLMVLVYLIQSIFFAYKGYVYGKEYILELMKSEKLNKLIDVEVLLMLFMMGCFASGAIDLRFMNVPSPLSGIIGVLAALGCYYGYSKNCRPIWLILMIMVIGLTALI